MNSPQTSSSKPVEPPNDVSRRLHARYGFEEVGSQPVGGGAKRVSLPRVEVA